jgi:N6-L-threonylcarbamoyladenine synthase
MQPVNNTGLILGIESSCDETAAAIYHPQHGILSSTLFSQAELHKTYGGVVPEIASRSHIEKIGPIVDEALSLANVSLADIETIGVTSTPGLSGSLLTGLCFAKGIAYGAHKKIIGVNHLQGHVYSACIENDVPFPFLCLTASGGHTSLYFVKDYVTYDLIGTTIDDAAGEAFDKIAKLLNLGYPGGPIIEQLAREAGFKDYFNYPRMRKKNLSLSFSGLKTAVLYDLVKRNAYDLEKKIFTAADDLQLKQQVASSLLVCIKDIFIDRLDSALDEYPEAQAITFVGGVACNAYLREQLQKFAHKNQRSFFTPSPKYCTDNAAMIAFVASKKAEHGMYDDLTLDIF